MSYQNTCDENLGKAIGNSRKAKICKRALGMNVNRLVREFCKITCRVCNKLGKLGKLEKVLVIRKIRKMFRFIRILYLLHINIFFFLDNLISFGGVALGSSSIGSPSVEVTSPVPNNHTTCQIPNLPETATGHSTVHTQIGIISCGGWTGPKLYKCHRLSSNNSWVPFPPMNERRVGFAMVEGNGKLFAVGGISVNGEDGMGNSMEWIDLNNGTSWTREDIPFRLYGHCMTRFNSSHAILTGGWSNFKVSKRR